ncbi:MAG: 30S ribosomal protein S6 [Saprospiraceae bacterium]|nr:30S ribosomal protein S6 [Saprospiraceae bacterium]MDW8483778.1 30S ribosomal protein S6 [Saprospiraceae bacterium]
MRHYEVTFIVDPLLSSDEVKATAEHILEELKQFGATIVAVEEMGLRQLAYPIKKRSSGVYYCYEFACTEASWLAKFELNLRRNEKLLRFLIVKLDKYGIKYNDDKRNGRIGKRAPVQTPVTAEEEPPIPEVVDLDQEELINE